MVSGFGTWGLYTYLVDVRNTQCIAIIILSKILFLVREGKSSFIHSYYDFVCVKQTGKVP